MPRTTRDPAARPALQRGIPEKLVNILLDHLGVDEEALTFDARLVEDLGADSLDIVELQMAFEAEFGLRDAALDDGVAERWATATIKDILADLRRLGARV